MRGMRPTLLWVAELVQILWRKLDSKMQSVISFLWIYPTDGLTRLEKFSLCKAAPRSVSVRTKAWKRFQYPQQRIHGASSQRGLGNNLRG